MSINYEREVGRIRPLLDLDANQLRAVPDETFQRGWQAIACLYPGLHPDDATEHGEEIRTDMPSFAPVSGMEPRLVNPFYAKSGWPVVLAPVAEEAWRRYEAGELAAHEFYYVSIREELR